MYPPLPRFPSASSPSAAHPFHPKPMKKAHHCEFGTLPVDVVARLQVREAMIEHLEEVRWTHVATLTHRNQNAAALWTEFRRMLRRLERETQGPIVWFAALEGVARRHPHLHVLFLFGRDLPCRDLRACWKAGDARLDPFEPGRGMEAYITKEFLFADWDAYDVSWAWPDADHYGRMSSRRRDSRPVSPKWLDLGARRLVKAP